MKAVSTLILLALFAGPILAQGTASQPTTQDGTGFIRVSRDEEGNPESMEIATARFQIPGQEATVDLVGVVHIAEGHYYRALKRRLARYDAVLYELVAPKGTRVPKNHKGGNNPLSLLQGFMKDTLGLQSQLSKIDYHQKNFIHADLSFKEMGKAMRKRGDTPLTLALGVALDVMRQMNKQRLDAAKSALAKEKGEKTGKGSAASDVMAMNPLTLLFDPSAPSRIKRVMAEQMADSGSSGSGLKSLDTLLIKDRNTAAIKVMDEQLKSGKKRIAIFYGAAHMPDFQKRLLAKGFVLKSKRWHEAWDLGLEKSGTPLLMKLLKGFKGKKAAPQKIQEL